MKEFMLKHPIIAYLIIGDICVTIENIMLGRHRRKHSDECLAEIGEKTIEEIKSEIKKNKEPIGFKFAKEEA